MAYAPVNVDFSTSPPSCNPDPVADLGDYSYTLLYTTPSGDAARFDPTIRNNR